MVTPNIKLQLKLANDISLLGPIRRLRIPNALCLVTMHEGNVTRSRINELACRRNEKIIVIAYNKCWCDVEALTAMPITVLHCIYSFIIKQLTE